MSDDETKLDWKTAVIVLDFAEIFYKLEIVDGSNNWALGDVEKDFDASLLGYWRKKREQE